MLTPMDIHDHQFKKSFRGYSENEVDDFLDKIVEDFEKLINDNERLKTQLYTAETELEKYRGLEKTMNDTLMVAQRTADEVISAARKNAENMKEQTARECQQIREQAKFEAKQQVDNANMKRDVILADYARLVSEKHSFMLRLRMMLEAELVLTNRMLDNTPKVDEEVKKNPAEEKIKEKSVEKPVKESVKEPVKEPPVETPKPEEKILVEVEDEPTNIVEVSTKAVTDKTITYSPVKPAPKTDEEAAK